MIPPFIGFFEDNYTSWMVKSLSIWGENDGHGNEKEGKQRKIHFKNKEEKCY